MLLLWLIVTGDSLELDSLSTTLAMSSSSSILVYGSINQKTLGTDIIQAAILIIGMLWAASYPQKCYWETSFFICMTVFFLIVQISALNFQLLLFSPSTSFGPLLMLQFLPLQLCITYYWHSPNHHFHQHLLDQYLLQLLLHLFISVPLYYN